MVTLLKGTDIHTPAFTKVEFSSSLQGNNNTTTITTYSNNRSPVYIRPLIRIRIQIRYNEGLANLDSNQD